MKKLYFLSFILLISTIICAEESFFTRVTVRGGEMHYLDICKSSPTVIYAGSQNGGLWVSKDGGQTWTETKFFKTTGAGTSVFAVHGSQPNFILACFNKEENTTASPSDIYKSDDYGETWQSLNPGGNSQFAGTKFIKLLNSPKEPDTFYLVYAANADNCYVAKTTDKGSTWTTLESSKTINGFETNPVVDACVDINNNLFAIVVDNTPPIGKQQGYYLMNRYLQLGEVQTGWIFVSTNNVESFSHSANASYYDGASTHTYSLSYPRPAPWTIASGSNTVAFAAVTYSTYTAERYYGIYVATSTNQSNWEEYKKTFYATYANTWTVRGIYFARISTSVAVDTGFAMAVSPDGQKIYCYDPQKRKVMVSTFTAGVGFGEFFDWSTGFLDGLTQIQANSFYINPQNPDKMYITDQSRYGILISSDGGKNWYQSSNGISSLIVYDGGKSSDGKIYVLSKMSVYKSADNGETWSEVFSTITPQGQALELDEATIVSPKENVVILASDGYVYRSEDGGTNWELVLTSSFPVAKSIVFARDNSGVGYIAFREKNPGEISGYKTSRKYIYKTTDWGKTWTPLNLETMSVQSLAIHPKQPNIIYAGLGEVSYWENRTYIFGGLKKITLTDTGTVTTEDLLPEGREQINYTGGVPTKIIINPDNPDLMYASINQSDEDKTYGYFMISQNGGKGWQTTRDGVAITYPIEVANFPPSWNKNLYDIKYSSGILYWINPEGVFALIDNTSEVKLLARTSELGTAKCLILGSLYAGTSTGLYKLAKLPTQLSAQISDPKVYSYPNPCDLSKGQIVTLKYMVPQGKNVEWLKISIYNIAGELIYETPEDRTPLSGGFGYYYSWDGKNQSGKTCARGVYLAIFKSNLGVSRTKIVLVK